MSGQPDSGMDPVGWFIATTHSLLGHDKTAACIGVPAGDRQHCLICQYEQRRDPRKHQAVIEAIGHPGSSGYSARRGTQIPGSGDNGRPGSFRHPQRRGK